MTNEIQNQEVQNQEVAQVVRENDQYSVRKDENGKYVRKAKYNNYSSFSAETKEDKIWLFNLLEGNGEGVYGMKECIGQEIEIKDVIMNSYDSVDEETGEIQYGVLTYILDPEGNAYVTSSKSVYFTVKRIMELFGDPSNEDWENVKVKITSEKAQNGNMVKLKMIG